ncbi:MAG: SDR family NAD(P)-dependent oxidoreductase [Planctomycetes bacterium]|nr:SDR family NAD(P)-dependent oxidoreductase [Planctomycetota bacterium]
MSGPDRGLPGALRAQLAALAPASRAAALLAHVRTRGAWFLQLESADAVDPHGPWTELGLDSLRAVDFRGELAHDLDLELRSTLLFDQPTPLALVDHLLARLGLGTAPVPARQDPAAGPAHEPIAIVGAACRFPGGESLDEFQRLLTQGRDAVAPIPRDRFDVDEYYDPDPNAAGKLYVREAALLEHIDRFDAACFGISPREAVILDPQQRLLLETSLHAFEHANLEPASLPGDRVGVYVGMRASAYFDSQSNRTAAEATAYQATGNEISTAAGRIAYTFGFQGPCYALDTACSGSLVAVHVAVRALRAGECDVALAGGVNTIYDPVTMSGLCRARMLSPDGRCKTFDASANGYGRGEGCGMVVLKRLADAVAAGDRVLAVVRGTAINQDGRSGGLTVPHGPAQTAVIRSALADAGVGIDAIDYVEAHGTGTALGDPIEVGALDAAFAGRSRPLPIGSVKTNIGHLESAAGISGLLKVVLALQARTLPKNLHFRTGNPHIDWARSITRVVTEPMPLPPDRELFAGVSSFGFSGTNAHVVLASAPQVVAACRPAPPTNGPFLLGLQAATAEALRALADRHAAALEHRAVDLAAWCHAAAVGRGAWSQRAAFVARERGELVDALHRFAAGDDGAATAVGQAAAPAPPIAFLFPGQGAQRPGMGRELYEQEPAFRDALDAANERLADVLPASLPELMWGARTDLLDRTDVTQPVLCAYELALLATFRSVGVAPEQVLGHSIGDFPAAVAAGVMDGSDALRLCAARGRLMVERCTTGGLLVVLGPLERWQAILTAHPGAAIAVRNGLANFAVGGDRAVLRALQQDLEAAGVPTRALPVSHAFHTAHTEPMLDAFAAMVAGTRLRPPERTFLDCKRGTFAGPELATAAHWRAQVREPVDFLAGLQLLAQGPCRVWFELGPAPMLTVLARDVARRTVRVLPAQRPGRAGRAGLLTALADAWVAGVTVDLAAANHRRGPACADLPGYPFQRERFWLDRRGARHPAGPRPDAGSHPLLGRRIDSSLLAAGQSLHQGSIALEALPWLADHVVFDRVLLPGAAMCELALAAEVAAGTPLPVSLSGIALRAGRPLSTEPTVLELLRTQEPDGRARVALRGRDDDGTFRAHLDGSSGPWNGDGPGRVRRDDGDDCSEPMPVERLYSHAAALRLAYGPAFRCVQALRRGPNGVRASVRLAPDLAAAANAYVMHPVLLDGCLQASLALLTDERRAWLPFGIEELVVFQRSAVAAQCHLQLRTHGANSIVCDLALTADDGRAIATLRGLQLVPADAEALAGNSLREHLHHFAWDAAPAAGPAPLPVHTALLGTAALVDAVAQALPTGAATVTTCNGLADLLASRRVDLVLVAATDPGEPPAPTFAHALAVVRAMAATTPPPRLGFVTHGTFDAGPNVAGPAPVAALLHGFVRTLALEQPALRPFLVDLDPALPPEATTTHAAAILAELRTTLDEPELALRGGARRVRRLQRGAAATDQLSLPTTPFHVRLRGYGSFENLACLPMARRAPAADEIEVELHATALNFKDVLHARGMLRAFAVEQGIDTPAQQPLGLEGTGVVLARGERVTGIAVGDTVVVQAYGCLASHVTLPASLAFVVPPGIDPLAAAGTPVVGSTVLYGLFDLAAVRRGETVLVHAAAGGVGQAAIALLQAAGCRVLATASAAKRAFVRSLGAEVVGDSRGDDFRAAVRAATGGRGVDVVLNTLAGDVIPRSLDVLAKDGRFVELGKLGVWTAEQVAAARPDVRFFAFELGAEARRDPSLLSRLHTRVAQALADGTLRPPTTTVVPVAHLRSAFDHLARGLHVGKVVVTLPRARGEALRPDRSWLVTGGSGAVALAVARELVHAGARNLVLLARGEVAAAALDELRDRGAAVQALRGDVADRTSLHTALRTARASMPPFQGVVHAAGVLDDATLTTLEPARAAAVLAPKVDGALLLDELLAEEPLDCFVLTTSMAGTFGNAGQAAYAAANSFLDAFAAWRRARGRPATAIAFGPWAEAGMAARMDDRLRTRLRQAGIGALAPAAAARFLVQQRAAAQDCAVLPIRWPEWLATQRTPTPRLFAAVAGKSAALADREPRLDLRELPREQRRSALYRAVQTQVAKVLGFNDGDQLTSTRLFRDFGLDSLLAVDAKDRLERLTGLTLPATLLFDQPDLDRLVDHLHAALAAHT